MRTYNEDRLTITENSDYNPFRNKPRYDYRRIVKDLSNKALPGRNWKIKLAHLFVLITAGSLAYVGYQEGTRYGESESIQFPPQTAKTLYGRAFIALFMSNTVATLTDLVGYFTSEPFASYLEKISNPIKNCLKKKGERQPLLSTENKPQFTVEDEDEVVRTENNTSNITISAKPELNCLDRSFWYIKNDNESKYKTLDIVFQSILTFFIKTTELFAHICLYWLIYPSIMAFANAAVSLEIEFPYGVPAFITNFFISDADAGQHSKDFLDGMLAINCIVALGMFYHLAAKYSETKYLNGETYELKTESPTATR